MTYDEILSLWEKDSVINISNVGKESLNIPLLHSRYLKIHGFENTVLKKLKSDYKKLYKIKWEYYHGNLDIQELKRRGWDQFQLKILKQDVSVYLDGDDDLSNSMLEIELQQEKVSTLNEIIKSISQRNFVIKNYIDWQKFENGVV